MPFAVRAPVLAFCLLVLAAAGCGGSNNKGLIEGKWKVVSVGASDEAKLRDAVLTFGDDGFVRLTRPGAPKPTMWRYKLLAGAAADFYGLVPDPPEPTAGSGMFPNTRGAVRVTIRIEVTPGDRFERREMTLTDPQGQSVQLVRTRE
jgi:hypothetical protein